MVLPLFTVHSSTIRHEFPLLAWASSQNSLLLATSMNSEPPLPQYTFQIEQMVGQFFCDLVDVPVTLLEALPGYRKWPVQTPLSLITRRLNQGHFCRFEKVSTALEFYIILQKLSHSCCFSHYDIPLSPLHFSPSVFISICPCSICKIYFIFNNRDIHASLSETFFLVSLPGSVDCTTVILYLTTNIHL